jgi:DNA-binding helix-hairpin-helix protein with protein kinase domain
VENAFSMTMFGVKLTAIGNGGGFNLDALWIQIESIRPTGENLTPPSADTYIGQCQPEAGISEILTRVAETKARVAHLKKQGRPQRVLGAGGMLLAVILVASGLIPGWVAGCILLGGGAAMVALWRSAKTSDADQQATYTAAVNARTAAMAAHAAAHVVATTAHTAAMTAYRNNMDRWNRLERTPSVFQQKKQQLRNQKQELADLPGIRAQRLGALRVDSRQKQLTRFLEKHRIENANIPGIGPSRKARLRSFGVEDASDVTRWLNIKGFGPELKNALWAWRASIEGRFVFDPHQPIDPADLSALDQELARKRAALVQSLSAGPQQLRQALVPWEARSRLTANLDTWAKQIAQAEANLKALNRL